MNKEELTDKLLEFAEYLNEGSMMTDIFRWLGWAIVRGIATLVDGLEKVTDEVLLIKVFFENEDVAQFLVTIRPLLWLLFALSLIFVGYLLIFQRKMNTEIVAINIIICLGILTILGTSMSKVNDFTDATISFTKNGGQNLAIINDEGQQAISDSSVNEGGLYGGGSVSDSIIKRNVVDLVMFDRDNWKSTDIEEKNNFAESKARYLDAQQKFDADKLSDIDIDLSKDGKKISQNYLALGVENETPVKFDQGGLEYNNVYYYRYTINWFTILVTLAVMGFTLFSIAYKICRLSFELAFNHILATIIAPIDIHDGQKTKKIIQDIIATFAVIILIFISMKLYILGTSFLEENLSGIAYLIALIAFSVAVVDGPNMVEKLFGIDAGLKNGWGLVAGAYAATKLIGSGANGLAKGSTKMASGMKGMKDGKSDSSDSSSIHDDKSENDATANSNKLRKENDMLKDNEQGNEKTSKANKNKQNSISVSADAIHAQQPNNDNINDDSSDELDSKMFGTPNKNVSKVNANSLNSNDGTTITEDNMNNSIDKGLADNQTEPASIFDDSLDELDSKIFGTPNKNVSKVNVNSLNSNDGTTITEDNMNNSIDKGSADNQTEPASIFDDADENTNISQTSKRNRSYTITQSNVNDSSVASLNSDNAPENSAALNNLSSVRTASSQEVTSEEEHEEQIFGKRNRTTRTSMNNIVNISRQNDYSQMSNVQNTSQFAYDTTLNNMQVTNSRISNNDFVNRNIESSNIINKQTRNIDRNLTVRNVQKNTNIEQNNNLKKE